VESEETQIFFLGFLKRISLAKAAVKNTCCKSKAQWKPYFTYLVMREEANTVLGQ